jgi:hypothetical protein
VFELFHINESKNLKVCPSGLFRLSCFCFHTISSRMLCFVLLQWNWRSCALFVEVYNIYIQIHCKCFSFMQWDYEFSMFYLLNAYWFWLFVHASLNPWIEIEIYLMLVANFSGKFHNHHQTHYYKCAC